MATIREIAAGEHRTIALGKSLLEKNATVAQRNRNLFREHGVFVVNVLSSPGAGKTELLGRLVDDLGRRYRMSVVVADLATDQDARRLAVHRAPVLQITTGTLCHLEAEMLRQSLRHFDLANLDILLVENVGNLVCPAGYDLGESLRVVVAATTEGEDKPLKYPTIYRSAGAVLLNKIDLAAATQFNREASLAWIGQAAPQADVFEVSARTGEGLATWHDYVEHAIARYPKG